MLAGKLLPYLGVAAVDLAVIVAVEVLLFDVPFNGSPLVFALGALLFLFVTVGIRVLISTVSETQGQAIQLAIMTMLPQILLSGLIFPLQAMAAGVRWIGYLLPLTYFVQVARGVMVGASFEALLLPLACWPCSARWCSAWRSPASVATWPPPAATAGTARTARTRTPPPRPGPVPGELGLRGSPSATRPTVGCEDVTFEVAAGTVAAVVGGDGAGKTSLLRALAGTVRPAAGTVWRPDERRLGYVSAGPGIWTDLTVDENLRFAGRAYGLDAAELDRRIGELLERTGLAAARDRLAGRLSGMRQKLALAMAVTHEPDLLVLDEPSTGVDPVSQAELWSCCRRGRRRRGRGRGHHLPGRGRARATVLVLDRGRELLAGTPDELLAATPGLVVEAADRPRGVPSWRRGAGCGPGRPTAPSLPGPPRPPSTSRTR